MLPVLRKKRDSLPSLFNRFLDPDLDPFENLSEQFDRFFGNCCHTDEDGNVIYQVEVPGFNKNNLKVEVADGILTISGEREVKDKYYAGQSKFHKRLTVGEIEDADANVTDGILTLTLKYPKPEVEEVKAIEVK